MSDTDQVDGEIPSLKGRPFDEARALAEDIEHAKVYVYKKPEGSGRWDFCFSFLPGEYDELETLEKLTTEYGAGEYPVQIKSKQADGRPLMHWQSNMRVVARRDGVTQPQLRHAPAQSTDAFAIAIETQTRLLTALLEKISQPAPIVQQKTIIDFAKELAPLKDLFGGGDRPSMAETIREALELSNLLRESGGVVDPLTKAMDMFGPKIIEEMDAQRTRPQAAAQPQLAAPAVVATAATTAQSAEPFAHIDVDAAYSIFVQNYLTQLLAMSPDAAPQALGNFIADRVRNNPQLLHVVGLVIEQDDMVERLTVFNPRVMARAQWVESIADWLAHALWPETNPPPTPENATIHATSDEKFDSQGINGAATPAPSESRHDVEVTPDEPGLSTSPGQLDNDP